jgi:hypothetical protein
MENGNLYTLIPLEDFKAVVQKISFHADFLHGILLCKTPAKALITAASMPPKAGGNLL